MTVYQDLLRAAGSRLPPLAVADSDEEFMRRLVKAVSETSMARFEAMPKPAQDWFDSASDALRDGLKIPLPDGYQRERVIRRPTGIAPSPTRAPPGRSGEEAVSRRAPPDEPVDMRIARLVAGNEHASLESVEQQLRERGVKAKRHSVSTTFYFVRKLLGLLREIGWRP